MTRGPFGGPRPLASIDCLLTVKEYTAMPAPTISGGMSPDRTDEFRQAAQEHLPVDAFTSEPHSIQPDLFGDVMLAELDTDRLPLNQYLEFAKEYARLLGTDDLRVVNTGIDARTTMSSRVPRPFADVDVVVAVLVEIVLSDRSAGEVERIVESLRESQTWIADVEVTRESILIQHHGGPNDLVLSQTLDLHNKLLNYNTDTENITVVCSVIEPDQ